MLGSGEGIVRVLGVAFAAAAIPFLFLAVRRLVDEWIAGLSAFALALNAFFVEGAAGARLWPGHAARQRGDLAADPAYWRAAGSVVALYGVVAGLGWLRTCSSASSRWRISLPRCCAGGTAPRCGPPYVVPSCSAWWERRW